MPYEKTEIDGVYLFKPRLFVDTRGEFFESFQRKTTLEETGFDFNVAQVNNSRSAKGVMRGIHFKENPPGQAKFVSVTSGSVVDVVIDLRTSSRTFQKWQAFELSAKNNHSLLIGNGIGHVFWALEDDTQVSYLCNSIYEPGLEHRINPLSAGINWQRFSEKYKLQVFLISEQDQNAPNLDQASHLYFQKT